MEDFMNIRHLVSLTFFTLIYFQQTIPVVIQRSVLYHPEYKKTVVLYGDLHEWGIPYIRQIGCSDEIVKKFVEVCNKQLKISIGILDELLYENKERTCIITETGKETLFDLLDQEAGFVKQNVPDEGVLFVIPRLLARYAIQEGETPEEKKLAFKKNQATMRAAKSRSYLQNCVSIILHDNLSWIIGDTDRTAQDLFMCFTAYKYRERIVHLLQNDAESLPDHIRKLSIGFIKNYIKDLHDTFACSGFVDQYGLQAIEIIDNLLVKSGLSESNHIAELYLYLAQNNDEKGKEDLIILIIGLFRCINQKQDEELKRYMHIITTSSDCDLVILLFGAGHTSRLKKYLLSQGYQEIEPQIGPEADCLDGQQLRLLVEKIVEQPIY